MMDKVKVNENTVFQIRQQDGKFLVNDELVSIDVVNLSATRAHILHENKSYNIEIVAANQQEKTCKVKVNGTIYETEVEDQYDQLLKQLGMDNLAASKVAEMKAPMPGLVLKVLVEADMDVKKGDNLLILEAMKMENILKATADGVVAKVAVKQGDKVEKNQILVQFKA